MLGKNCTLIERSDLIYYIFENMLFQTSDRLRPVFSKFRNASQSIYAFVQSIKDENILNNILKEVILCNDMNKFQYRMERIAV